MKPVYTHKAIRDHMRHILRPPPKKAASLEELKRTEWDSNFEQLMRNRLVMGSIRYETFEEKRKGHNYDIASYIRHKLDLYDKTGNTETLVDIANLAMIEFVSPQHPNAHFHALDESRHVEKFDG